MQTNEQLRQSIKEHRDLLVAEAAKLGWIEAEWDCYSHPEEIMLRHPSTKKWVRVCAVEMRRINPFKRLDIKYGIACIHVIAPSKSSYHHARFKSQDVASNVKRGLDRAMTYLAQNTTATPV